VPFWLYTDERPPPLPPLTEDLDAELLIVGGGFTGLWTALQAKERTPDRHVVLVAANSISWAASGRTGGFCAASLTHGYDNGLTHLPEENELLAAPARENLDPSQSAWTRYGLAWEFERTREIDVATEAHQIAHLRAGHEPEAGFICYSRQKLAQLVKPPTYKAALWDSRE